MLLCYSFQNDNPAHTRGRQVPLCLCVPRTCATLSVTVQLLNSSTAFRGMGGNHHFSSLIPGCKQLTWACLDRIHLPPFRSLCTLHHEREGPLLSCRLGHGCVAFILPQTIKELGSLSQSAVKVSHQCNVVTLFEGLICSPSDI